MLAAYQLAQVLLLVAQERFGARFFVPKRFLPPKLDDEACAEVIDQVIAELGASKLKDAGRVMTELKSRYPNRMDFARARRMICQQLA